MLESRGIAITGEARRKVLACTDEATLARWLSRVATVETLEELFALDSDD